MKLLKNSLVIFLFLCSFEANSATVNSVAGSSLNFGKIAPGNATGTMTSSCVGGNGVKSLGGCTPGTITISATNSSTNANGRRIMVYAITSPATNFNTSPVNGSAMTSSVFTITPTDTTNCVSASGGYQCTNPTTTNGNVKTWTFNISSTLGNILTTQPTGDYNGVYPVKACSCCLGNNNPITGCTTGCATSATTGNCSASGVFISASGSIPARIVTGLTVTENTALRFGAIASGASAGTVTETGAKTGGITVLSIASWPRGAGQVTITGEAGGIYNYTFTLPATVTLACDTGVTTSCSAAPNMSATLAFGSGSSSRTITSGQDVVTINGTLSIAANQAAGNYKGTYTITVNY